MTSQHSLPSVRPPLPQGEGWAEGVLSSHPPATGRILIKPVSSRPRAFVMISALIFIMLTALIILAVSRGFAAQATRTRLQAQQTQLEQILLAGRDTVQAGHPSPDLTPTLPPELQQAGYKLTLSNKTLTATVALQTKTLTLW
jgi:hypothetical protein